MSQPGPAPSIAYATRETPEPCTASVLAFVGLRLMAVYFFLEGLNAFLSSTAVLTSAQIWPSSRFSFTPAEYVAYLFGSLTSIAIGVVLWLIARGVSTRLFRSDGVVPITLTARQLVKLAAVIMGLAYAVAGVTLLLQMLVEWYAGDPPTAFESQFRAIHFAWPVIQLLAGLLLCLRPGWLVGQWARFGGAID